MSDSDISSTITVADPPSPLPPTPQETILTPTSAPPPPMEETASSSPSHITFSLWPPSQRTRNAVVARMIETLSTPSVLLKSYGTLPLEEAAESASSIEEEAFNAAGRASTSSPDVQILQIYLKEISKRMLDSVKAQSAASVGGEAQVVNEKAAAKEEADSEVKAEA